MTLQPPAPVPLPVPFDCINLWVYGNNWAWVPDPATPAVEIRVVLQNSAGTSVVVTLDQVRWMEWWLVHRRLTPEQIQTLGDRPSLVGIEIVGGRNTSDRTLYFDNLAVYQEPLVPLDVSAPREKRGIQLPDGQTVGNNMRARDAAISHPRADHPARQSDATSTRRPSTSRRAANMSFGTPATTAN